MLLGVTCHTEREWHATFLHFGTVNKETFIETVHLTHQVNRMEIAFFCRGCVRIALAPITTQHKNIVYSR